MTKNYEIKDYSNVYKYEMLVFSFFGRSSVFFFTRHLYTKQQVIKS